MGKPSFAGELASPYWRRSAAPEHRGADACTQPRTDTFEELQITLKLQKGDDAFQTRTLSLKPDGATSIQVGRASKTERKQLVAEQDNLWIANPVISREHAVLSVEKDDVVDVCSSARMPYFCVNHSLQSAVFLKDDDSSHGTFLNERDIRKLGKKQVFHGDSIQFGDHVMRGTGMLTPSSRRQLPANSLTDSFEPPLFRVEIKSIRNPVPTVSLPTTLGRSWSVPDESEESEMDESDSDVQSIRSSSSHSSPPQRTEDKPLMQGAAPGSSMTNPLKIDDDMLLSVPVEEVPSSREGSEEYEPEESDVVADTYFGVGEPASDDESAMSEDMFVEDEEAYFAQRQESPVYTPQSPVRHILTGPTNVTSTSFLNGFSQHYAGDVHHYTQGPFTQPSNITNVVSTPFSHHDTLLVDAAMEFANLQYQYEMPMETQRALFEEGDFTYHFDAPFSTALETPVPMHRSSVHATTVTTTQEILNQERDRANKKNMSITSLINPPAVAGAKRKADDISEDEAVLEVELEDTMSVVSAVGQKEVEVVGAADVVAQEIAVVAKNEEINTVAVKQSRPTKRLRTIASHVGTFALGGAAMLAGLVVLPENYFG